MGERSQCLDVQNDARDDGRHQASRVKCAKSAITTSALGLISDRQRFPRANAFMNRHEHNWLRVDQVALRGAYCAKHT